MRRGGRGAETVSSRARDAHLRVMHAAARRPSKRRGNPPRKRNRPFLAAGIRRVRGEGSEITRRSQQPKVYNFREWKRGVMSALGRDSPALGRLRKPPSKRDASAEGFGRRTKRDRSSGKAPPPPPQRPKKLESIMDGRKRNGRDVTRLADGTGAIGGY